MMLTKFFAHGLGPGYKDFRIAIFAKPLYPSFNQFMLAFQNHNQLLETEAEASKHDFDLIKPSLASVDKEKWVMENDSPKGE